jgi:DNA polymerase-3 subunit gamma/tau
MSLANHLEKDVHLVSFERGRIEFRPSSRAPAKLAGELAGFLSNLCGERWVVSLASSGGAATIAATAEAQEAAKREQALAHPLVQAALVAFPGAAVVARRDKTSRERPPAALPQKTHQGDETE